MTDTSLGLPPQHHALFGGARRIRSWFEARYWDLYCKYAFLMQCPPDFRVLDVGCGNNSPRHIKGARPDCYYVGLDIGDYNQDADPDTFADEYIIVPPEAFTSAIEARPASFDAVLSSHNLEHCDDQARTLRAMLQALRPGGRLFLSFPCEASVYFPRRRNTLNFFDDGTHKVVPQFGPVCDIIRSAGCRIDVEIPRYRPGQNALRGLLEEPRSMVTRYRMPNTWALYGFESIIWATRDG